jgi:heat shock protein HtpX
MKTANYLKTALLLGLLTGLIVACGGLLGGKFGMTLALGLAAVMNFVSYWFSDKIVLAMYRAKPVSEAEAPRLFSIVQRLTSRAGLPMPRIYVLPQDSPNAFATGRNPDHSALAVTQGLLDLMNDEELEGVIAHELGHVKNRDILISSVAATIAGAITWLAHMARWGAMFGGYGGSREDRQGNNPFALLAMAILAPIAAVLIQMAVSRSREYAADETGARFAGNPYGLARALEKLGQASGRIPMHASPTTAQMTSHMFIVNPFRGQALMNMFSTHPPLEERIRRLLGRP